ncbi:UDP-glucose--hexose-1-phosphate uridylyltransferase [Staphylococcus nepalensis]|uniref:UDP-glucose--hexose-1-phosphate uridylyltransferase n=1 Tax=Staphylococcus nepalensis TaxID=214473 RepID=UPI001E3682B1|nr:UDP-glucose--hexose-1-phosphate uridylyltransferase [Staphylococcus nepalensis]MCD8891699.1 UDP-glucose--hexose-1-phosphate uridylyltransferase [Staphylococcus nepalensis]
MLLNQHSVQLFVSYATTYGDYEKEDAIYIQNRLISILNASGIDDTASPKFSPNATANAIAQDWIQEAIKANCIDDALYNKEIIEAQILDLITPRPSVVNDQFNELYKRNAKEATDYFYNITKRNHYVKEDAIANNIHFDVSNEYGDLEITINLSKPEKDAKQIAKAKEAPSTDYPKCALCLENEGFKGSVLQAARTNHRIVRLNLGDEQWGFQYSPYAYFKEHSIVLSKEHVPMNIDKQTFVQLLDFVDKFPHYFIGSNADIPLVGGSILTHNHYQSGRHTFPMDNAKELQNFKLVQFTNVEASTLHWPMSVIRLKSTNKENLIEAAECIRLAWNNYSDESVAIRAYSDEGDRHHTVTPIARFRHGQYELDVVLRDNQTSETYPDGIFHPHKDVQHIKKENIGLIEVMGTAILPGRLKTELQEVKAFLLGNHQQSLGAHQTWAEEMKPNYDINEKNVDEIIEKEVGHKFKRVLEDAGVFKNTSQGQEAFERFIETL